MWKTGLLVAMLAMLGAIASAGAAAQSASPATYVVVLKPGVTDVRSAAAGIARANGGAVGFVYEHALRGFSVQVSEQGAAGIARNPNVAYVEADQLFSVSAQTVPTGIKRIFAAGNASIDIDSTDDKRVDVDVAVIDTGIDLDHPDLNVVGSVNCASGGPWSQSCGSGGDDGNGHGTHVAGTIAAIDDGSGVVGVAPGARLWAVRVLNNQGSGYTSWIVAGMDWVTARKATIEVANMSLGGGASKALDDAANKMADAGIALAVAAGNSDADAGTSSPARAAKVLTVSALADFNGLAGGGAAPTCRADQDDTLADFSNWGSTIEIAAPGVCITSTWLNGGYNTISGTSMASPHAAGALALLASKGFMRTWTGVAGLYLTLKTSGNDKWTDDSGDGVTEPLLDVSTSVFSPALVAGSGGGSGGGTDTPPSSVAITGPAAGSIVQGTVAVTASASDDVGVARVEFFVDGGSIGSDTNGSDGWSVPWNTSTVTNGARALTARATDTIGQPTTSGPVSVTVSNATPTGITLTVLAYKTKGFKYADLSWTGASTSVDVLRDGSKIASASSSSYTDGPLGKGSGSATYKVCAGTTCSNPVTVSW